MDRKLGKGEIARYEQFLLFPVSSKKTCTETLKNQGLFWKDSSELKEFADHNSKFDKNGRNFSKWIENTVGKGEIACYEQFLLFPVSSKKTCTADT